MLFRQQSPGPLPACSSSLFSHCLHASCCCVRAAREAEEAAEAAVKRGDPMADPESRFDSNCITPGTRERAHMHACSCCSCAFQQCDATSTNSRRMCCCLPAAFMARLGAHIRFFVRKKIAEDTAWQKPTIIFSGECPQPAVGCATLHLPLPAPCFSLAHVLPRRLADCLCVHCGDKPAG